LTKRKVKDGWILAKFFFGLFMDRNGVWSIKDLLYGIKHQNMINFPCGTKPLSQAGRIASSILPALVPAHGASHVISNSFCSADAAITASRKNAISSREQLAQIMVFKYFSMHY